jgi:hypothetical protein
MRRFTRHAFNSKRRISLRLTLFIAICSLLVASAPQLGSSISEHSTTTGQKKPKNERSKGGCSPLGDQLIYIPLIDLPEAGGGEIVFNSRSPQAMDVTPVFYKRNGETVIADPVRIESGEIRYVNIEDLVPGRHRHDKNWGGFALSYHGANREMWSQFRFLAVNGGGNVDEFFTVKAESRSPLYEAAWWVPEKSESVIALGNISDSATSATVTFGSGDARTVNLPPHATEVVRQKHRNSGTESVNVKVTGAAGSIVPTGIITAKDGSFNSVIRFYDSTTAKQPNLYANGFRLKGTTPHMILKNTTQSSVAVLPRIIPLAGSSGTLVLPQVSLSANETKEVDLSELLAAARRRGDLDVVSVEVANWAGPGSVIGALYATNDRTGIDYDVPLRDSGPIRSMTGVYPWKISDDYKSIVYLTNITDELREIAVELSYHGGKFTLGPTKLSARETAVFDIEEIRERRIKDINGETLPQNVSQGQFKWANHGPSYGKIVVIGRTEMVSKNQDVSSSYSCPTDCGPTYYAEGTFNTFPLFNGESGSASTTETAEWNYGYTMGPYPVVAGWTADYPFVDFTPTDASSITLIPLDAGTTFARGHIGWYDRYTFDGLNCVYLGTFEEVVGEILEILLAVRFRDVRLEGTNHTAGFIAGLNTANLNIDTSGEPGPDACGGDNFAIKVRFDLPSESAHCCRNHETSFVLLPGDHKFQFVGDGYVFYGDDSPPFVMVYLKRKLDGSGTNNSVRISVGGSYQNLQPYRGQGTVTLKCEE